MIIFGILFLLFMLWLSMKSESPVAIKAECKPHKWIEKQQVDTDVNYLQCENCSRLPGSEE